jgi:hypothetical protein
MFSSLGSMCNHSGSLIASMLASCCQQKIILLEGMLQDLCYLFIILKNMNAMLNFVLLILYMLDSLLFYCPVYGVCCKSTSSDNI